MIIPVRCFTCGKVRIFRSIHHHHHHHPFIPIIIARLDGRGGKAAGVCAEDSPSSSSSSADGRPRPPAHQLAVPPPPPHPQVIANKYEVYVQYLKNDYKEGYVVVGLIGVEQWRETATISRGWVWDVPCAPSCLVASARTHRVKRGNQPTTPPFSNRLTIPRSHHRAPHDNPHIPAWLWTRWA